MGVSSKIKYLVHQGPECCRQRGHAMTMSVSLQVLLLHSFCLVPLRPSSPIEILLLLLLPLSKSRSDSSRALTHCHFYKLPQKNTRAWDALQLSLCPPKSRLHRMTGRQSAHLARSPTAFASLRLAWPFSQQAEGRQSPTPPLPDHIINKRPTQRTQLQYLHYTDIR